MDLIPRNDISFLCILIQQDIIAVFLYPCSLSLTSVSSTELKYDEPCTRAWNLFDRVPKKSLCKAAFATPHFVSHMLNTFRTILHMSCSRFGEPQTVSCQAGAACLKGREIDGVYLVQD